MGEEKRAFNVNFNWKIYISCEISFRQSHPTVPITRVIESNWIRVPSEMKLSLFSYCNSARYATLKIELFSIFQLVDPTIMRQIQLEMIFYAAKIILGAEVDIGVSRTKIGRRDGK